jgi:hypothetical protein
MKAWRMCEVSVSGEVQERSSWCREPQPHIWRGFCSQLPFIWRGRTGQWFHVLALEWSCLFCNSLTLRPWASCLYFLSFGFLICRMRSISVSTVKDCCDAQVSLILWHVHHPARTQNLSSLLLQLDSFSWIPVVQTPCAAQTFGSQKT